MRCMDPAPRKFHRAVAPWLVLPLFVSLTTGICYRVGRAWFDLDNDWGERILNIHDGAWLGSGPSLAYVLVVGLGLLAVAFTGSKLLYKSRATKGIRLLHRLFGFLLFLPLATSAVTGMAFKVGEEWIGLPDDALKALLVVHEGAWLGKTIRPWYVLFVGLGLLGLIVSGLRMAGGIKPDFFGRIPRRREVPSGQDRERRAILGIGSRKK